MEVRRREPRRRGVRKSLQGLSAPLDPAQRRSRSTQVSLSVGWGEVFGLIGPNRAGKTTLVKILLSICHPTDGRIHAAGSPWSDRRTLADVGYVHENPAFPRYLSAWQLLEGYGRLSGVDGGVLRRRTGELLERVGLADRSRESIAGFSKGMLQRLALAQALINDPQLLVLDEPSEGMDLPGAATARTKSFASGARPATPSSCLARPGRRPAAVRSRGRVAARTAGVRRTRGRADARDAGRRPERARGGRRTAL